MTKPCTLYHWKQTGLGQWHWLCLGRNIRPLRKPSLKLGTAIVDSRAAGDFFRLKHQHSQPLYAFAKPLQRLKPPKMHWLIQMYKARPFPLTAARSGLSPVCCCRMLDSHCDVDDSQGNRLFRVTYFYAFAP
jgi:hypothetical protein